jgi:hypothetical protein
MRDIGFFCFSDFSFQGGPSFSSAVQARFALLALAPEASGAKAPEQ